MNNSKSPPKNPPMYKSFTKFANFGILEFFTHCLHAPIGVQ